MGNFRSNYKAFALFSILLFTSLMAKADAGLFRQFVILNRGSGNEYLGNPMSTNFNNVNLGAFCSTSTLILNGAEINTWQNGSDDVNCTNFCPRMYYRVYLKNSTPGSFSIISLGFVSQSGGDKKWDKTNSNINLLSGLASGTYVIEVYFEANFTWCCGNANRNDNNGGANYKAEFTVTTAPNAGTLSGTSSVCLSGTTTFTSDGNSGGAWSSANTSVATINSSTGLISPVGTGSSLITYTVNGSGGCSNATATRTVTVTANPNAGSLSGTQNICIGGTTSFTSSGESGGTWSSDNTSVATVNSSGLVSGLSNGTATITYTVSAAGCSSSSTTRTVTVNNNPAAPTGATGATICGSGTATISVADPGAGLTVDWYAAASGGSPLSGGTDVLSFTTPSISSTTIYYAQTRNSTTGCISSSRTAVTATVVSTLDFVTTQFPTSTQNICVGASFTAFGQVYEPGLTEGAGAGAGISAWLGYSNSNSDPSGTGWTWVAATHNASVTGNNDEYTATLTGLIQGNYFYAWRFQRAGCSFQYAGTSGTWSTTADNVQLNVNSTAAPTATGSQTFCSGATVASLVATGTSIQWYAASTLGSPLSAGTALVNGTTYHATQTVNGCESQTRTAVTVTLNALPAAPTGATGATICGSGTAAISVADPGAGLTVDWYAAASGGSPLTGGTGTLSFTTPSISSTTIYYAQTRNTTTGCVSSSRTAVTTTVVSTLDFVNLQFPATPAAISVGGSMTAYGRVGESGITNNTGQGAGIEAQFGYSNSNTNPNTWTNWFSASFNVDAGSNDEYQYTFNPSVSGPYYYTFRFRVSGCDWQYGGYSGSGGGTWGGSNVSGVITVNAAPLISITGTPLANFGSICPGSTSSNQSYSVSGSDLTANVSLTAPSGFEISTSSGSGFGNAVTLTQSGGILDGQPVTIYVRFAPGSAGAASGNISHASSGATTQNVAVAGTGAVSGTWVGGASGNWTDGANWCGGIPTSTTDVVIPSGVTVTVNGDASAKSVTITGTLQGSTNTLTVSGNWVNNGTFNAETGSVVFNAAAAVSGSSNTTFNNVTISAGVDFGASKSTINGILTINSGGFVNTNPPTYGTSSTLFYNTTSYNRSAEWTAGVLTGPGYPNNVTIGSSSQACAFNANNTPALYLRGNLTIGATTGSASSLTLNDNSSNPRPLVVGGNVIINATGTLTLGNINGANAGDIYVGGNWTRNGTFNPNSRAVFFNGSGTQTVNNAETFAFLLNDKSAGGNLVLAENVTVTGTLTLTTANTATLTVSPGKRLTFASGVFNGDAVVLRSTNDGTASIGPITGSLSGATNVTVERYIPARRAWRMLTAPLKGSSNNSIFANWQSGQGVTIWAPAGVPSPASNNSGILAGGIASSILRYNGTAWEAVTSTTATGSLFGNNTSPAASNQSYAIFVTAPFSGSNTAPITGSATATTLSATGTLQQGAVTFSGLTSGQFHLIGNPYPSAVNLSGTATSTNGAFYVWDAQAGSLGAYKTWDAGSWVSPPEGSDYSNAPIIQSGQAFFINATGTASVTFNEANKVSSTTGNVGFRTYNTNDQRLRVRLSRIVNNVPNERDAVLARFDGTYSPDVDDQDIVKANNFSENMSLVRSGSNLVIERRSLVAPNDTLFLRLWNTAATNYEMEFSYENFQLPAGATLVLRDLFTGTERPLVAGTTEKINFTVTSDAKSTGDRFQVVFRNNTVTPVRDLNGAKGFAVYPNPVAAGSKLQLQFRNRAAGKYQVVLFNMTGSQVLQQVVQHGGGTAVQTMELPSKLATGTYIAEITSSTGVKEQVKITIQ
jgi:hypothetical protein